MNTLPEEIVPAFLATPDGAQQAAMGEAMFQLRIQLHGLTEKLEQFLATRPPSPFLAVDLDVIRFKYRELREYFPTASIHYAVKANPAREVVLQLAELGSHFDIASPQELDMCLGMGVHAAHLSYGNTVKKMADIEYAFRRGVRRFAFDSEAELRKLALGAHGAMVMCRIQTTGENADWPLSRKFGCDLDMAEDLLRMTQELGVQPIGVTFHVGSQQTDPTQWRKPLREAAELYRKLAAKGIDVYAAQALCAGKGRFGALIQVGQDDVKKAGKILE